MTPIYRIQPALKWIKDSAFSHVARIFTDIHHPYGTILNFQPELDTTVFKCNVNNWDFIIKSSIAIRAMITPLNAQ